MLIYLLSLFAVILATEALVEVVVKSEIFRPLRETISKLDSKWLGKLFSCGYCFSFWIAASMVGLFPAIVLSVSGQSFVDVGLTVLIVQRLSNVLHNIIDKWTDKFYDVRYVNSDKD